MELDDRIQDILNEHGGLIKKICMKYQHLLPSDELQQAILIGIWRAINKYKFDEKKAQFNTYLGNMVKYTVLDTIKNNTKIKKFAPLFDNKAEKPSFMWLDLYDIVPKEYLDLFEDYYIGGYTINDIAIKHNSEINKVKKDLKKLKERLVACIND